MLAVAADGERYRVGHYGAITKVPRGNLAKNGDLVVARTRESHRGRSGRRRVPGRCGQTPALKTMALCALCVLYEGARRIWEMKITLPPYFDLSGVPRNP